MDALYKAIVEALARRGQQERDRREEWERSLKPTQYLGNNLFQEMGGQPLQGRYLGKRSLIPGQFVPNIGRNPNKPVIPGLPNPVQETIEDENNVYFDVTIFLSYSIVPNYEFDGTNVLDAFQINITGTINNTVVFDNEIAIITPFAWVPVGNPIRTPNGYSFATTFSQSNTLNGIYTNTLIGFTQPVQVVSTPNFERYRWASGRGFDGNISGSSSIDGSNDIVVTYRARILTAPTEDINLVNDIGSGSASILVSDEIARTRNITIDLFHSIHSSFDILNEWNLSSTLSGSFLPNPQVSLQWQYSDKQGWIYWIKILRGIDTNTAYNDQYLFGFQGRLRNLRNTKVYGKRTFIDGSTQYAESEIYENLVYGVDVITPLDFRPNPSSYKLVFT